MAGECGEACNLIKKLKRLEDGKQLANIPTDKAKIIEDIGKELADTVIYIDLLAERLGINLADAIESKFNIVSERVGSNVRLDKQCGLPLAAKKGGG